MRLKRTASLMLVQSAIIGSTSVLAYGSLTMEMYASALNGVPIAPTKLVQVSHIGDIVTLQVRAVVTGLDPTKYQLLQSASGSILSTGALKGNISSNFVATAFRGTAWSPGLLQDLD